MFNIPFFSAKALLLKLLWPYHVTLDGPECFFFSVVSLAKRVFSDLGAI